MQRTPSGAKVAFACVLLATLALTHAACSGDTTGIVLTPCTTDDDCANTSCVDGFCALESGDAGSDAGEDAEADAPGPCDGDPANACGHCFDLTAEPGDSCDDACGVFECGDDDEDVVCIPANFNECGTCGVLEGAPGTECDTGAGPGTWICSATGTGVTCAEGAPNACGGAGELEGEPGDACGECDGVWRCEGESAVVCEGGAADACGGCLGPFDVEESDVCACAESPLEDEALWSCDGDFLICLDANDGFESARNLGEKSDQDDERLVVRDSLQTMNDRDWFIINGVDNDGTFDGLNPDVQLRNAPAGYVICVQWRYLDDREWSVDCQNGRDEVINGGNLQGCCTQLGGDQSVVLESSAFLENRLDGGLFNDATGQLRIEVFSADGETTCDEYELRIKF